MRRFAPGFLTLARQEPERFRVIDASRPAEEVSLAIRTIVDKAMQ